MDLDTRWITLPIMCGLALLVGDVSLWVIVLVIIGSAKINFKL